MMASMVEVVETKSKRSPGISTCLSSAELTKVREENARLRAEKSDALSVCQEVYSDPNAPAALRLKAAGLALPHEVPRLEPVQAPMDLIAEPVIPLADLVAARRKRQAAVQNLPPGDPRWDEWIDKDCSSGGDPPE